jgi:predicted outer membrane repeat protein
MFRRFHRSAAWTNAPRAPLRPPLPKLPPIEAARPVRHGCAVLRVLSSPMLGETSERQDDDGRRPPPAPAHDSRTGSLLPLAEARTIGIGPMRSGAAMAVRDSRVDHQVGSDRSSPIERALFGVLLWGCIAATQAATIVVDSVDDVVAVDGACTLREAVANANTNTDTSGGDCASGEPGLDEITFDAGLSGSTIMLASRIEILDDPLAIIGPGADLLALDGTQSGILVAHAPLSLTGLRFQNARSSAVLAVQSLTVSHCTFAGNVASGRGGAIQAWVAPDGGDYALSISDSLFIGNRVESFDRSLWLSGGAIFLYRDFAPAEVMLTRNVFIDNQAPYAGGAVSISAGWPGSVVVLDDNRFEGNRAAWGAGASVGGDHVTVRGDAYVGNTSDPDQLGASSGGGGGGAFLSALFGTAIVVEDAQFENNTTRGAGGGLMAMGPVVTVAGSTFRNNTAAGEPDPGRLAQGTIDPCPSTPRSGTPRSTRGFSPSTVGPGGGGAFLNASEIDVAGSTFADNCSASVGGGLVVAPYIRATIAGDSTVSGNTAAVDGGGIHVELAALGDAVSSATVAATVTDNIALLGHGGGIRVVRGYFEGSLDVAFLAATVRGNVAGLDGGGIAVEGGASNLEDAFRVELHDSLVDGNTAGGDGGGIALQSRGRFVPYFGGGEPVRFLGPDLRIERSRLAGNQADGAGGGIAVTGEDAGTVEIVDSTVDGNGAGSDGGGFALMMPGEFGSIAALAVAGSTFSANTGQTGGGLALQLGDVESSGSLEVMNTTIHGNAVTGDGGGIALRSGATSLRFGTVTGNSAGASGGGIHVDGSMASAALRNSIVAGNDAAIDGPDVLGVLAADFSLIGDTAGAAIDGSDNLVGLDPRLEPLADHGGPTFTRLPRHDSPVLDAGDPAFAPPPATDQRGLPRIARGRVDIGAAERQIADDVLVFASGFEPEAAR